MKHNLPISKLSPPITRISPSFLKIPHAPTLLAEQSSQIFFINKNATVKLSLINTIHVKQQCKVGFFIFKFTLKYMLGNVYINTIHARQCSYIISLYCREIFSHSFNFFVVSKGILHIEFQNSFEEKILQWNNFQLIPIWYCVNKRILFPLINKSLVFNLIAI